MRATSMTALPAVGDERCPHVSHGPSRGASSAHGEESTMRRTDCRAFASAVAVIRRLFGLTLGLGVSAQAETTLCTPITSLPATITVQGIYCLTSDFSVNMATGSAVTIDTNNVVIDLNG